VCRPSIHLETKDTAAAGKTIEVTGALPAAFARSPVRVALERPVGSQTPGLEPLPDDRAKAGSVMMANHERANSVVLATEEVKPTDGTFRCTLSVPADVPWSRLIVRATAATEKDMVVGVMSVRVMK